VTEPCASCHQLMDPIGMGFDQYDAIGRFQPGVDGSIEVVGADGLGIPQYYASPVELGNALAESDVAHACFATQWYRYAMRRDETAGDACAIRDIVERWRTADWDVVELLVAIATSKAFRSRAATESE
jgi:hypothetical protein